MSSFFQEEHEIGFFSAQQHMTPGRSFGLMSCRDIEVCIVEIIVNRMGFVPGECPWILDDSLAFQQVRGKSAVQEQVRSGACRNFIHMYSIPDDQVSTFHELFVRSGGLFYLEGGHE